MFHDPQYHARTDTKPREPWQQILLEAADLIERAGWCQGDGKKGGRHCIIGAMSACFRPDVGQSVRRLSDYLGGDIIAWNDAPGRTIGEVLEALRGCADLR